MPHFDSPMRRPETSSPRRSPFRQIMARLHDELRSTSESPDIEATSPASNQEPLYDRVARAKARWLRRVMYGTLATSTEKCFAYSVAEHLNCVTLDAWPGQARLIQLLGFKSIKTIQRAAFGLQGLKVLTVTCSGKGHFRYAPTFLPEDEDKVVRPAGHTGSPAKDKDVQESLLLIHNSSSPRKRLSDKNDDGGDSERHYRRTQRGAIEYQIAAMLGDDGMEILSRLGAVDDAIVERLCRAYAAGALGGRELIAARLAAEQVRR